MKYLSILDGDVTSVFACPQSPEFWSGIVEVEDDDPRYLAFLNQRLPVAQSDDRVWRDTELAEMAWLRDRHRDQVELGIDMTLDAQQYSALMAYIQALRDWPQASEFPQIEHRPMAPEFLVQPGRSA